MKVKIQNSTPKKVPGVVHSACSYELFGQKDSNCSIYFFRNHIIRASQLSRNLKFAHHVCCCLPTFILQQFVLLLTDQYEAFRICISIVGIAVHTSVVLLAISIMITQILSFSHNFKQKNFADVYLHILQQLACFITCWSMCRM